MAVDISGTSFRIAWTYHYKSISATLGKKIIGGGGATWSGSSGLQSCALRMSIALAYAGVHWPRVRNSWQLKGTNVYFPTLAGDYRNVPLLADGEDLTGTVAEKQSAVDDRKGVLYFGGNFASASGHLTLWDGNSLHFPTSDNYWDQPNVVFWEMAN